MKKLLVVIASLLIAVSAHAQFGVVAGITSTKANIDDAITDVQNVTQYHVGLTYKIQFGSLLAIQPAIIYNVKGSKLGAFKVSDLAAFEYKTGYLEIPVQVQVGFDLGLARIYGIAEPFIGYALTSNTSVANFKWEDVKNKLEYGVGIGAGVELIKHVQVSARYFWNLGAAKDAKISTVTDAVAGRGASGIIASVALLF
ncbi:MAG: PorT family protein [Bacteroidales bacterium]|nr:PorT family protein [Bacteroidales bacterium]